jgi:hydroxypyruvate reductase
VVGVLSGGGSALLPCPVEGVSLEEKRKTTELLLASGATIQEVNAVRKHLSRIKGGQMARLAQPARLLVLVLSDVVGDDLSTIASGPAAPDPATYPECLEILDRYGLREAVPLSVRAHLEKGALGEIPETPKPGDPVFARVHHLIVGNNLLALRGARQKAASLGYETLLLSSMIQGEAREVAKVHGAIAREIVRTAHPVTPPCCILSGGETTVTVRGRGLGGRNQEFALSAAVAIADLPQTVVLSGGTDGKDGPTDAAGAIVDGTTVVRARGSGLDPLRSLAENDSYRFLERVGDLLRTGPTGTNVMDLHLLLVGERNKE